ncbi:hypothetical protein JCGZ_10843 [Jatropha curcas]|uniref:Uncharacterized protein n=1 Tax=Jatropha curcas TaxID=180498 RepID=A0A067KLB5_JATCU|nr:hypothetical protein JCGZ_10843 [Jatropha curcas]
MQLELKRCRIMKSPVIHAVYGDCSVKGGVDCFIFSIRSFLLHHFRRQSSDDGTAMNGSGEATIEAIFNQIRHTQSKLVMDLESP